MIIKIQNHKWKILRKTKEEIEFDGNSNVGLTFFPNREIWLLDSLKDDALKQVVTHEVVHALLNEFACSEFSSYNDEFICEFIAGNLELIKHKRDEIISNIID